MKIQIKAVGILMLVFTACSGTYNTSAIHDDIYFSPSQAESIAGQSTEINATPILIESDNGSLSAGSDYNVYAEDKEEFQENYENEAYIYYDSIPENDIYLNENETVIINYNDYGYNDYYYASRIRRFHNPWASFNYYDPYFTNMYWYNYDPYSYGMSIYMGYDPYFGYGYGFPSAYYSWGYRPWAWTHYGYGWGYGSPWGWGSNYYGYWPGYYNSWGYYGSPYYYDYNQVAYNPRRPSDPVTGFGIRGEGRYRDPQGKTEQAVIGGSVGSDIGRYGSSPNNVASTERVDQLNVGEKSRNESPAGDRRGSEEFEGNRQGSGESGKVFVTPEVAAVPMADAKDPGQEPGQTQTRERYTPERTPEQYQRPENVQQQTPRYARPQQNETQPAQAAPGTNRTRTYTPPSQQQPRSNQEYRRPPAEQPVARPATSQPQRPDVAPSRQPAQSRPQAVPQRSPERSNPQAVPQRAPERSNPQVAPQRSPQQSRPQASPQRSEPQRPQAAPSSSPQRSSPSYSPPSRNSGNSSSGTNAGSSSPSRSSGSSSSPSRSGSSSSPSRR